MAAIFSSSVKAVFIWLMALALGFGAADDLAACSLRLAFFADTGIFPET